MTTPTFFDHIEVHVNDIPKYCRFLKTVFGSGRYKVISDSGTAMFKSDDGLNIEIKKKDSQDLATAAGFCNPCLRREKAKNFIEKKLKLKITKAVDNPDGKCYFFIDHEGITWHIKEYLAQDKYINW